MEANDNTDELHHSSSPHSGRAQATLTDSNIFIIIVAVTSVILLVVLALIIIMLRRLKSSKKSSNADWSGNGIKCPSGDFTGLRAVSYNSSPDVKGGCLYVGSLGRVGAPIPNSNGRSCRTARGVQVFTYKELEAATDRFNDGNVIGNGGFGVIYRGVLSDGTVAAIKMLHREGKQGEHAFRVEVDLLSRLHSPYLVDLLGYCADQSHRLLVFEYMPHGSLQAHLHPSSQCNHQVQCMPLDWGTRLRIALDCARALEFLHEHAVPSVIHRDFKCTNVLLGRNFCAKVSDFGLAKMGSDKINGQISTRVLGTTGYLAPEYASTGKLTTKSDVYSYGVVLLELLTGRVPVDTKRGPGEQVLVSWALPRLTNREKLEEMVDPALKGQYSKKELIQVAAIAAVCVQSEADYRPIMTDIVQSLIPLVKNYSAISSPNSMRFQYPTLSPSFRC
ncbi:probable serine/threonine-protein kinase PBL7 [Punica granatum]|uniref:Protein kinase domain-containing protein n=2 Tax=Punica granatum TaxID=22663 RepID=A0A218XM45_PUNGR|nr:probable serine/threonine-protein kinase PBL7 [Punica granatum]OWM85382.1 hypothetical protein CDL15_Pgr019006 [Punica granatum]PKI74087.1 hypothetical protein CRG98_005565 [Punica granatum]